MGEFRQLSPLYYTCDYQVAFVLKHRFRILTGTMKAQVEELLRISQWKEVEVLEQAI
ncbi:hypothetical protein [Sunxiuqinia rutila]